MYPGSDHSKKIRKLRSPTPIPVLLPFAKRSFGRGEEADSGLAYTELEDCIAQAIEALPPKTKLVFSLSRYERMSYKAIAEQLDISVKSVEKHMGIALERLRFQLKDLLVFLLFITFFENF